MEAAGDWDAQILDGWIDAGVPMGIDEEIQTAGIFPPADKDKQIGSDEQDQQFSIEFLEEFENYTSMEEHSEEAAQEFARMMEHKYAIDLPRSFWQQLRQGHVHKMAPFWSGSGERKC